MIDNDEKRFFFAFRADAPWPENLPTARLLKEPSRHMTLVFLGQTDFQKLQQCLNRLPLPSFKVGFAGKFDEVVFLPPRHPHVAAWHVEWLDQTVGLEAYQQSLMAWLRHEGFHFDQHDRFLAHVTLGRSPFNPREWEKEFKTLPVVMTDLHLYESVGGLEYIPRWTLSLKKPFIEIEHTADIAFIVRGEDIRQLRSHAFAALSFKAPALLDTEALKQPVGDINEIIMHLNHGIAEIDEKFGCPFKAVSYHGEIEEDEDGTLVWEMIVDV